MKLGSNLRAEKNMKAITEEIIKIDPKFWKIIKSSKLCDIGLIKNNDPHFKTLVQAIISQQLATKAAETINQRVAAMINDEFEPEIFLNFSAKEFKSTGVSGAKARAITELSLASLDRSIDYEKFDQLSNHEITQQLTRVWGIGQWTSEMFLIFQLSRLDVWPVGDLAVRRGWTKIHNSKTEISPEKLAIKGNRFAGFQSVVAWYCWRAVDN
jgi:DNA-3-methyladenine glycosylase II